VRVCLRLLLSLLLKSLFLSLPRTSLSRCAPLPLPTLPASSPLPPRLVRRAAPCAGEPDRDFERGIKHEHTEAPGHDMQFRTHNYGILTCPSREYAIVTGAAACPPEDMRDGQGEPVRRVRPLGEVEALAAAREAGLNRAEVTAVVRRPPPLSRPPPAASRPSPPEAALRGTAHAQP